MNGFELVSRKEIPGRETFVDMDTDSDEEAQSMLERAVLLYKRNKKEEKVAVAPNATKREINEIKGHQNVDLVHKSTENCAREYLNGDGSMTSDMQDLIKYFIIPKKVQKNQQEACKKTLRNYEKQGAIPKNIFSRDASNDSKKIQTKDSDKKISLVLDPKIRKKNDLQACLGDVSLNGNEIKRKFKGKKNNVPQTVKTNVNLNLDCGNEREETFSRPFFYIVPERPSPNFSFPRGSYYVVPKAPNSHTRGKIIFHPESSTHAAKVSPDVKVDRKAPKNVNNLGKDVPQRIDSHLNIGPEQVREESVFSNLEASCSVSKIFEKAIISPDKSSEAVDVAQEAEGRPKEVPKENKDLRLFDSEESDHSDHLELVTEGTEDRSRLASEESVASRYPLGQVFEDLSVESLDHKIQEQYAIMVACLPESRPSDLLDKCIEFQGNEEEVVTYIQETQRKKRKEQLATDLQYIFPDADPSFLLREVENSLDDENAITVLSNRLLEGQNYPRVSPNTCKIRKKLWLTYVINFDVKNYLLKVPKPEDFAGAAGDNNKADEKLIMAFLFSRHPTESIPYLKSRFEANSRNITKTCANMVGFVRLSESSFEHENFDEDFLKEICYIDHREEIDNHLKTVKEMKEIEAVRARLDGAFLFCPLCSDEELIASEAVTCPEGDVFCKECIRRYVEVKVGEATYKFACPVQDCQTFFTISTLEEFLPETVLSIVIRKQQVEEISTAEVSGLEFCQKCDFAYIPDPQDKVFKCQNPTCMAETCRKCHEENHIPLRCEEVEREVDLEARKKIEEAMSKKLFRRCPTCQKKFVKIDGCNLIKCVCGTKSCYICNIIIQSHGHFNKGTCPMYSNNEELHTNAVLQAGVQVKNEILKNNPNIRIVNDPTKYSGV